MVSRLAKVKAKGCAHYDRKFNHEFESSSHIVTLCFHVGSYVMNALDYKYKLRSVIGREDDFTANKWKWFDTQVRDTFLWSWMISWALVDYTDMGSIIGRVLDNVYALSVSMKDSIGSITYYFHTSMVVHPGSNDYLRIRNLIHGNILSSSSKKQRNGKVSWKNFVLRIDYQLTINLLMKQLYIAVRYFYIINRLTLEEDYQAIYTPTVTTKNK